MNFKDFTLLDLFKSLDNKSKTLISKQALELLTENERKEILNNILVDQNYGYTREHIIERMEGDWRGNVIRAHIVELL